LVQRGGGGVATQRPLLGKDHSNYQMDGGAGKGYKGETSYKQQRRFAQLKGKRRKLTR